LLKACSRTGIGRTTLYEGFKEYRGKIHRIAFRGGQASVASGVISKARLTLQFVGSPFFYCASALPGSNVSSCPTSDMIVLSNLYCRQAAAVFSSGIICLVLRGFRGSGFITCCCGSPHALNEGLHNFYIRLDVSIRSEHASYRIQDSVSIRLTNIQRPCMLSKCEKQPVWRGMSVVFGAVKGRSAFQSGSRAQ